LKGGFHCLWTDSDIVFYANPLDLFESGSKVYDLQLQSDDDDICAGFFYARSNARTTAFFDRVIAYLNPAVDDQVGLRRHLALPELAVVLPAAAPDDFFLLRRSSAPPAAFSDDTRVRYSILDRALFPNGTAYYNAKLPQRLGITPFIVHNNCIIGHDSKKER